ncbi:Bacterial non-heme ferritin [bioreactor metagenome]|uniref:Bacterial non-heme ferritin n=1 Tax=bioreactor metagenome TaxID=1076179 RepID=A0A644TFT2_9ZZZZ|nr:ferritin [Negativicutes bacterium]
MISQKMQDAINGQIQAEFYSAYLYLSMSAYCEGKSLKGFANWLNVQYQEEVSHATKLFTYLGERGGKVRLATIDAPPSEFGTLAELFEMVLTHEQHVTDLINKLYEVAVSEKDFAAQIFLQWFINEQVEEESSVGEVLDKLAVIGEKTVDVLYLDKELSTRVFVPPAANNA